MTSRASTFRALHAAGCFVMPNPWDVGSAKLLAPMGFPALATTSAGFAWSAGKPDHLVTLDEMLRHLRDIVAAVDLPINADFEGGFAIEPDDVGRNVRLAVDTGIAGLSIEDSTGDAASPLFDTALAVERIAAARQSIDDSGSGVVLTARSEGFVAGRPDLDETVRRLTAYAEAGADCLFAPGLRTIADIEAVVHALAPKPVNVLMNTGVATVQQLADLGVRRISVGGALARVAWSGFLAAAHDLAERGSFDRLGTSVSGAALNSKFRT